MTKQRFVNNEKKLSSRRKLVASEFRVLPAFETRHRGGERLFLSNRPRNHGVFPLHLLSVLVFASGNFSNVGIRRCRARRSIPRNISWPWAGGGEPSSFFCFFRNFRGKMEYRGRLKFLLARIPAEDIYPLFLFSWILMVSLAPRLNRPSLFFFFPPFCYQSSKSNDLVPHSAKYLERIISLIFLIVRVLRRNYRSRLIMENLYNACEFWIIIYYKYL